jgi:uncharacterized membrane protein
MRSSAPTSLVRTRTTNRRRPIATFTVWKFPTSEGAEQTLSTLERVQKEEPIEVHDAAIVTWPSNAKKPKTRQLHNLAGAGALGVMFWGMRFGLIFLVPLFVAAIGAATGALAGKFTDVGIDDKFINLSNDEEARLREASSETE